MLRVWTLTLLSVLLAGCSVFLNGGEATQAQRVSSPGASELSRFYQRVRQLSAQQLREVAQRDDLSQEQHILLRLAPAAPPALTATLDRRLQRWQANRASGGIILLALDMRTTLLEQRADKQDLWRRNQKLEQLLRQLRNIETHIQSRDNTTDDG